MSPDPHVDPRVQRSQQRLRQAMVDLILDHGYQATSVREITAAAGVSYPTFFRHYASKDALLLDAVGRSQAEMLLLLRLKNDAEPAQAGYIIFEHVGKNEQLYRVLLLDKGAQHLLAQVQEAAVADVISYWQTDPGLSTLPLPLPAGADIPFDILAHHFVAGIIALLRWWLEHDRPYGPERMGQIYADLLFWPIQPLLAMQA